eukprot:TRINITY_DN9233_c0_g1_i5.p1 TRINITY_DN9233_c0_g1~~TRINITY_DN9233_c0_g1_i5.p1  ORF type:complete len:444 (-),score=114.79 TRINITY_DN9233_c0_g1_i5:386-1717(-)
MCIRDRDGMEEPVLLDELVVIMSITMAELRGILKAHPELEPTVIRQWSQLEPMDKVAWVDARAEHASAQGEAAPVPFSRAQVREWSLGAGVRVAALQSSIHSTPEAMLDAIRNHSEIFGEGGVVVEVISGEEIAQGKLASYDVLLVPGGDHHAMMDAMRPVGQQQVREFVKAGGGYVGTCGGAYLAEWLALLPIYCAATNKSAHGLSGRLQAMLPVPDDFGEVFSAKATDALQSGGTIQFDIPPLIAVLPPSRPDNQQAIGLLRIKNDGVMEDPMLEEVWDKYSLLQGRMPGSCAIVAGQFGLGRLVVFNNHPEKSGVHPESGFEWSQMIAEAVAHCSDSDARPQRMERLWEVPDPGDIVQSLHGNYKHVSQPCCCAEMTDSDKRRFDLRQCRELLDHFSIPVDEEVERLLELHTLPGTEGQPPRVLLKRVLLDVLFAPSPDP